MRILFAATDYIARGKPATGFPAYLYRLSKSLVRFGHRPVIVAAGQGNGHRVEEGVEVWTVNANTEYHENQFVYYLVNSLKTGWAVNKKIRELLEKEEIDIIQFTSLSGLALFYHGKVPAVLRLSSYAKTYFATNSTYTRNTVRLLAWMERMSAGRCVSVFAPCRITAEAFGKDIRRNVQVIETPFVNDVTKPDDRYLRTVLRGRKYALFFGTLYAEKGILVIADCIREFLQNNPEYYFVFAGEITKIGGVSAAEILNRKAGMYRDRVIMLGPVLHEALYPVIENAEFVVLPSLMDNLPNACIEAMYFSRIVIGTDGASFEQLITHEKNGLLCRIGDAGDLLEKMQMVTAMNVQEKEKMQQKARRRIERLKPEYAVRRLLGYYEYVIKNV